LDSFSCRIAALVFGLAVIGIYAYTIILYLAYPGYKDHIERLVTDISWLAVHGRRIYPDWTTGDAYGMIYGPLLYFVNGVFILLSPTIFMSKLPGIAACVAAVWFFWRSLRKKAIGRSTAFLFVAVLCAALLPQQQYPFCDRADSFLFLIVSMTLAGITEWPIRRANFAVGALAGIAAGFKLHGISYVAPAVLNLAARAENPIRRIRALATIGAVAAAVILLIHSNAAMLTGYVKYLSAASRHGLSMDIFKDNVRFALCYTMPPVLLWIVRRPSIQREDFWLIGGLALSTVINVIIGSKPGAGYHHLMPLIPVYLYVTAIFLQAPTTFSFAPIKQESFMAAILFSAFLLFGHTGLHTLNGLRHEDMGAEQAKIRELNDLLAKYPNAQIGIGDKSHYFDSDYRTLAVFRGDYPHIDFAAWIDLAYGGVPESAVAWMFEGCRVPAWILSGGQPFSMPNYYTGEPMFSDDLLQQFFANYRRAENGKYFQAWVCKTRA
jgi:hypothetical protein